jgi:hypothetical protein
MTPSGFVALDSAFEKEAIAIFSDFLGHFLACSQIFRVSSIKLSF